VQPEAGLIRDGFMAAVSRMPENSRPSVRVYDTGVIPVGTALQNARTDGAAFIVGPLTREELQVALEQRVGNLPMLLLNNIGGSGFAGANIYQYGLAPEDEARQIARQIAGAGQRNAMVLAPAGAWGTRVAAAFTEELTRSGGQVVVQASYDRRSNDLTAQVESAFGITDSIDRHQKIRGITRLDLGFQPRPRPDIDAIFVAGYPPDEGTINPLQQINPVLKAPGAQNIPVYITQGGLSPTTQANRDLLDMRLLDMPWTLEASGPVADLRASTESIWKDRERFSRYFAFGFDAATLALAIRRPSTAWPLNGLTGRLNLTVDGRVERSLQWARVGSGGVVQPADPGAR
jgi:outer membrane PBP1 activator LpoA protein